MSTLWLANFVAFSLQVALIIGLAVAASAGLRLLAPRVLLQFYQAVLAVALVAPLAQPWRPLDSGATASLSAGAEVGTLALSIPDLALNLSRPAAWMLGAGVIVRLFWLAIGCWRLGRHRRGASPLDRSVVEAAGMADTGVRWLVSPAIDGPATYGVRRPVVLLPAGLDQRAPDTVRAILAHELIHVRRRDWLFVLLEEFVRAALWFHPAIWWLLERIHLHREQTVDEEAVALLGDRRAYLTALIESAVLANEVAEAPAPAWLRRRHLRARLISAISAVKEAPMSRRRLYWSTAGLALVLASATTGAAVAFPLGRPAAPTLAQPPSPQVYDPGNGVTLPALVKEVRPQDTRAAMQAKVQGTVLLSCVVQDDGKLGDVTVVRSLDAEHGLDDQAVAAAKQWEFKPGTKNGKPVAVRITIELRFTLK